KPDSHGPLPATIAPTLASRQPTINDVLGISPEASIIRADAHRDQLDGAVDVAVSWSKPSRVHGDHLRQCDHDRNHNLSRHDHPRHSPGSGPCPSRYLWPR